MTADHPRWPRDSFDDQAEEDMARLRPARRLASTPDEVIAGVRAAADMDHPWIPGADAVLIRDAATLLEQQAATIAAQGAALKALAAYATLPEPVRDGFTLEMVHPSTFDVVVAHYGPHAGRVFFARLAELEALGYVSFNTFAA